MLPRPDSSPVWHLLQSKKIFFSGKLGDEKQSSGKTKKRIRKAARNKIFLRQQAPKNQIASTQGQKRSIFVQTRSTANPMPLMFYPGKPVMEVRRADFPNARAAMNSPLA